MTASDLTPAQLSAANQFLRGIGTPQSSRIYLSWDDLVQIVAWYGALRHAAGCDGIQNTVVVSRVEN